VRSHTVPRKLLEQFAYFDPKTGSLRLWRYEKDRPPYSKASPKKETALASHLADPEDPLKEKQLETRLAQEFEAPVNKFLFNSGDSNFVLSEENRRKLAFYVALLFFRSKARRRASTHLQQVTRRAYDQFLENESQVLTVATKWNIDLVLRGLTHQGFFTSEEIKASVRSALEKHLTETGAQGSYIRAIERMMSECDEKLLLGEWKCIRTAINNPFIISDAPVVTWERLGSEKFSFGMGFHRENVEVFLPVSPEKCLHILPNVNRTRKVSAPTVKEVNIAQAAFAARACYSHAKSDAIDKVVQDNFGRAELGVKSFTVWHRDYSTAIYDILMHEPRWLERTARK
jgi:hypothetical protein